jgi:hypothetical protein
MSPSLLAHSPSTLADRSVSSAALPASTQFQSADTARPNATSRSRYLASAALLCWIGEIRNYFRNPRSAPSMLRALALDLPICKPTTTVGRCSSTVLWRAGAFDANLTMNEPPSLSLTVTVAHPHVVVLCSSAWSGEQFALPIFVSIIALMPGEHRIPPFIAQPQEQMQCCAVKGRKKGIDVVLPTLRSFHDHWCRIRQVAWYHGDGAMASSLALITMQSDWS